MGEKRRGIRRTAVLVTLSLVAVTAIVAGVYLVTRDPTPTIREELLDGVEPSPDCPDTPGSEPPGEDEVVIEYFVVEERCLRLFTENVAETVAEARVGELRARSDVLAANRQVHAEVQPEAPATPRAATGHGSSTACGPTSSPRSGPPATPSCGWR